MYNLQFREQLPITTAAEFDALVAKLKAFLLLEHNEDGSHRLFLNKVTANPNDTLGTNLLEEEGHWWRKGPWLLDDVRATDKHIAGIRPPDPPAGTYNDYGPVGIDTAVLVELKPTGNITIAGLKAPIGRQKRILVLRNRDTTFTITLTHAASSSLEPNRFDLPNGDDIVLGPGQGAWLYWDPARTAYTLIITSHQAGGTGGAIATGLLLQASITLSYTQVGTLNTLPIEIVPAPAADKIIFPVIMTIEEDKGGTDWTGSPLPLNAVYRGQTVLQLTTTNLSGAINTHNITPVSRPVNPPTTGANFHPAGIAMDLYAAGDRAGGSGTYRFTMFYFLVTPM